MGATEVHSLRSGRTHFVRLDQRVEKERDKSFESIRTTAQIIDDVDLTTTAPVSLSNVYVCDMTINRGYTQLTIASQCLPIIHFCLQFFLVKVKSSHHDSLHNHLLRVDRKFHILVRRVATDSMKLFPVGEEQYRIIVMKKFDVQVIMAFL